MFNFPLTTLATTQDSPLLLCKTCLHAVYHRSMAWSRASQTVSRGPKWGREM